MNALSFLLLKKIKNQFREFLHKPSKIILALILVFCIFVTIFTSSAQNGQNFRSVNEFFSVIYLLYTFLFYNISKNGFNNGASLFSMADINLIFVSPTKSSRVLFFGILQQLGHSLYLGLFILFQYTIAHEHYGIGYGTIILVALGYGITVLFSQMVSMLIYVFVGSSDKKTNIGKVIYYSVIIIVIAAVLLKAQVFDGLTLSKVTSAATSPIAALMPVSGFVTLGITGIVNGQWIKLFIAVGCAVAFSVFYYITVSKTKGDFYEDVLKSTEVSYSAITAAKQGKTAEAMPRNIKTGKTGLTKGFGASAIKEKQRLENRRSKVFLLSKTSIVIVIMTAVYSFVMPDSPIGIFVMSIYTMVISVSSGSWAKELGLPYIYLIPEKPFKKLCSLILTEIPSLVAESVVCLIPVHFILKLDLSETAAMIAARISFGFIFIGTNLVLQRIFGKTERTVFSMTVYVILIFLFSLPSVAAGIFTNFMFPFYPRISFVFMFIFNLIVFPILLFISRNVLEYSEYNFK